MESIYALKKGFKLQDHFKITAYSMTIDTIEL